MIRVFYPILALASFVLAATLSARTDLREPAPAGPAALTTFAYRVHRMPEMVAFYTEAFGVQFREVDAQGVKSQFGSLGTLTIKFVPIRDSVDFENFPVHQPGFDVADIQTVIRAAERHGGRLQNAPERVGDRMQAAIRDPDGNTIELYAPR